MIFFKGSRRTDGGLVKSETLARLSKQQILHRERCTNGCKYRSGLQKTLRLRISEIKTVISTELYYYWPPRFTLSPVQRSRCRFDLLNLSIANCGKDCFRRSWKKIIISKRCLVITCANWHSRWPFEETFWWPKTLLRRSVRLTGRYFKRYEGRA